MLVSVCMVGVVIANGVVVGRTADTWTAVAAVLVAVLVVMGVGDGVGMGVAAGVVEAGCVVGRV